MYIDQIFKDSTISEDYKNKFKIISEQLKTIVVFHQKFLSELLKCNFNIQRIAESFLSAIDNLSTNNKFYVLVTYAIKMDSMTAIIEEKSDYFNKIFQSSKNKLDIKTLLIEPIQRMPKYKVMITDVVKELHKYAGIKIDNENINFKIVMDKCTRAAYVINRVLENMNDALKLNSIDFSKDSNVSYIIKISFKSKLLS